METLQPKNENKVSLLSIPASDLDASTPNEMLLLQLPPNLSVDDLHSAVFSARPGQPASLVTSHQSSFALQRVETSNAFIMVAPTPSSARVDDRCTKRSKVTDTDKLLTVVPARLLKTGGSGASFLELRKKKLRKVDLWNALKEYVWDPYNSDRNTPTTRIDGKGGRTVADMAIDLQFSEAEILHRLDDVPSALAFPTAETTDTRYMLVAEEPMQECYAAILATLAELAIDYATEPLPENFAAETTDRFTENFDGAEILVGHCLRALQNKKRSSRSALYLDVAKVARVVANQIFLQKPSTIEDTELFNLWQSKIPGVGIHYQVQREMLNGLAVKLVSESENKSWKFLPVEKMPLEPTECFEILFKTKEFWCIHELEPYLEHMADAASDSNQSPGTLLLRFTKTVQDDRHGISVKMYAKK